MNIAPASLLLALAVLAGCRNDGKSQDTSSTSDDTAGVTDGDGDGWTAEEGDCDDGDASVNPDAIEVCDGVDEDCDDVVDDDPADTTIGYADADGDGYGDATAAVVACEAPSGTVTDATDCDDADALVHPAAPEVCDGHDDDCDGLVDESDPDLLDGSTWYLDADSDGYGDASAPATACESPTGYLADDSDCDDADSAVNPGQDEVCNAIDDDCDGAVAEVDLGRVVGVSDEWFLYDTGTGAADISVEDNETLVVDIWAWLHDHAL